MKRAYLTDTKLLADLGKASNHMMLDSTTTTYLINLLGSDYCYIVIGGVEIVKVLKVVNGLATIERDWTKLQYWPKNTVVKYQLTPQEIMDSKSFVGYSLSQDQAIEINNGEVSYQELDILGFGGINMFDELGRFIIEDIEQNAGCCGVSTGPIPDQYLQYRVIDDGITRRVTDSDEIRSYV